MSRRFAGACAALVAACGGGSPPPDEPRAAPLEIPPLPPSAPTTAATVTRSAPPGSSSEAPAPPAHDPARAESLFRQGRDALANGDLLTARACFAESEALDPAVGTALNLADVEQRLGDTRSARTHFQSAYDRATAAGQTARAAFAKARLDALPP